MTPWAVSDPRSPGEGSPEDRPLGITRRLSSFAAERKILLTAAAAVLVVVIAGTLLWTLGIVGSADDAVGEAATAENTSPQGVTDRAALSPEPAYAVTAIPEAPECARPPSGSQGEPEQTAPEIEASARTGVVQILTDTGSGSGFVANDEGIIVTDSQVVGGNWLFRVRLADGKRVNGELFGVNERLGVAYVKIDDSQGLNPIPMGDSDELCIGDAAFSAGYPSADDGTETSPSISQGMITSTRGGFLRTDASLRPGDMGGPVLDANGHVVGVNSIGIVVAGDTTKTASNFAIPINGVKLEITRGLDREQLSSGVSFLPRAAESPLPAASVPPTPLPAPTAVPAPVTTPTPTPLPTATPIPTPTRQPTATPSPTPTRSPTATPRPQPTRRPTSTPRPTPTRRPTATPRPTATSTPATPALQEYRNDRSGYTLEYPIDWTVDQESGGVAVLRSRDGAAFIEILTKPISRDWSLAEFTEDHRAGVLIRAANWQLYQPLAIRGEFRGATNFIHQEFRRRETSSSCIENAVSHIYRTRFFPAELEGFVVTMSICEDSLRTYGSIRESILSSFEEFQTN